MSFFIRGGPFMKQPRRKADFCGEERGRGFDAQCCRESWLDAGREVGQVKARRGFESCLVVVRGSFLDHHRLNDLVHSL